MKHPEFKQYSDDDLFDMLDRIRYWRHYTIDGIIRLGEDQITIEELNEQIKKIKEELDDRYSRSKLSLLRL